MLNTIRHMDKMILIGLVFGNLFAFQDEVKSITKMEIKWHEIKQVKDSFQLTVEGTITPKVVYDIVKDSVSYDRILITSFDMEGDDFRVLSSEFGKYGISNEVTNEGIEVLKGWFDCIFELTDYGESQDSYKLLQSDSNMLSTNFDISVDYRDIPDLKVQCKSKSFLESIFNEIKLKITKASE